jgi:hypothetical protein
MPEEPLHRRMAQTENQAGRQCPSPKNLPQRALKDPFPIVTKRKVAFGKSVHDGPGRQLPVAQGGSNPFAVQKVYPESISNQQDSRCREYIADAEVGNRLSVERIILQPIAMPGHLPGQ